MSLLTRALERLRLDEPSPLLKQGPILGLFLLAVVGSMLLPSLEVSNVPSMVAGVVLILVATGWAALCSAQPTLLRFANIVPAVDFLALGVLRYATGESQSIFAALVVLPVIWFAANPGRRYIAYAALGAFLALLVPFLLGTSLAANPNELLRGLYIALVFALTAAVVNELSRQARLQLDVVQLRERAANDELSRAAVVQRALLPKDGHPLPGYQMAGMCLPSKAVGGDFFDWYPIQDGLGFTLGDVMGKGVGAGMIAATARAVVRSASGTDDPVVALVRTADCLAIDLSEAASFATLFHGRLRAADGRLRYADAGHGLTVIVRADGAWQRLGSDSLPVGLRLDEQWTAQTEYLQPGDMLVSFSDGVLDLYDGSLLAVERMAELAAAAPSADEFVDAVRTLAAQTVNPDDVTVVAVRRETA